MNENEKLVGVTECRFEPLHKGHVFMVKMSLGVLASKAERADVDHELNVIVCSNDDEIIPGNERYDWAQETFGGNPNINVHHAHNALESIEGYGDDYAGPGYKDDEFWGKVARELCGLGESIDYYFGSEDYVAGIAAACHAKPYNIDNGRNAVSMSGTIMRNNPWDNWDKFPDAVKPYFAKKVCIVGAPYVGKADLTKRLAKHYRTVLIDDVSSSVYNPDERGSTAEDLEEIAELHVVRANAITEQANKVVVSDSDALMTKLWSDTVFGGSSERLASLAAQKRFDLYLLLDSAGVEYRPSNSFPDEASWHSFTETLQRGIEAEGWPVRIIDTPDKASRVTEAVTAIDNLAWSNGVDRAIGYHAD